MRRAFTVACAGILLAGLAISRRASASDWLPEPSSGDALAVGGVVLLGGGLLVADVVFTVHDANLASHGVAPERGWAIAETAVGGLQTIGAVIAYSTLASSRFADSTYSLALIPVTWLACLGVHGVWGLAAPEARPSLLLAGSYAVAADSLLTAWAVRRAADGKLAGFSQAVAELVLTAPQIGLAVYGAATTPSSSEHAGLIALASWSGALFLHGAVSLVWPSKEPAAAPTAPPSATFELAPTVLRTATASAPGMEIRGVF